MFKKSVWVLSAFLLISTSGAAVAQRGPDLGDKVNPVPTRLLRHQPPFKPEPVGFKLDEVIGKRAAIFLYWLPDFPGAVRELENLNEFARSLKGDKVAVYTVARARDDAEAAKVLDIVQKSGISLPVLLDDMSIMMALGVNTVPAYVAVNKDGTVAVNEIGDLSHKVQSGERLKDLVTQAARTGSFPVIKGPGANAVYQLMGEKVPSFELKTLDGKQTVNIDKVVAGKKPTVLVFWSALCPHCQKEMPRFNEYLRKNPGKLNIVSVTQFRDGAHERRTHEFVKDNKLSFPVLVDSGAVNELFSVNAIPMWLLLDPGGKVSYITVGAKGDLPQVLDRELARASRRK